MCPKGHKGAGMLKTSLLIINFLQRRTVMKFNEKLISMLGATWQYYIRRAQEFEQLKLKNRAAQMDEQAALGYHLYGIAQRQLAN